MIKFSLKALISKMWAKMTFPQASFKLNVVNNLNSGEKNEKSSSYVLHCNTVQHCILRTHSAVTYSRHCKHEYKNI